MSTNSYHVYRPTQVKSIGEAIDIAPKVVKKNNIQSYLLKGFEVPSEEDFLKSRKNGSY